tara:strand:- start:1719 stop:2126 length:408 start_codon:yes stop_codon:yes gene_type:complete
MEQSSSNSSEVMVHLPPQEKINEFKGKLKEWLAIDQEISLYESKIKALKKRKTKELEPEITSFMVDHNISDVNTDKGKVKCAQRNVKKSLSRSNIHDNLSKVLHDDLKVEQAVNMIMNNREVTVTHRLVMPKQKQ